MNPFHRLVADTMLATIYGIDTATNDGELYRMVDTMGRVVGPLLLPGAYILEMLPSLQHVPSWMPGMRIKRIIEEGRRFLRFTLDRLDLMWAEARVRSLHCGFAYH